VWSHDVARTLIALQILAIFTIGTVTVARFHIFAPVDERAHLAYVQEVAEHGRIPLLSSYVPWQELAIEAHTYPRHSSLDPRLIGLRGIGYEAWQPPLYYALAAPAFLIPGNYRDKVFAVRAFDLLLLLAAVAILVLLARAVFEESWRVPYCLALSTILWPGVIVRTVTISNAALELPLVLLYVLVVWNATEQPRGRSLMVAGALLGLCALTQFTLVCLAPLLAFPIAALLREGRQRRVVGAIAIAFALPLILLAPWVVSNESRYGALVASSLVEHLTGSYESTIERSGLGAVTSRLWRFGQAALPQEWWAEYRGLLGVLLVALPVLLLLMAIIAVFRHPGLVRSRATGLLASPVLLVFATLAAIVLLDEWPAALYPRYANPMIPLFALFAAWAWMQARMGARSLLVLGAASSFVTALVWVYMAGAYYFTHVGASLGIHAAPPG
jgi:Dolichyl-phosphate-mannose-protein mannosyltransferase